MIKFTILLRRKLTLTHAEFVSYHKDVHAPLFAALPIVREHLRRYVLQYPVSSTVNTLPMLTPPYDGITELWFDNTAALDAVFSDEQYLNTIRPDEANFIVTRECLFMVTDENHISIASTTLVPH